MKSMDAPKPVGLSLLSRLSIRRKVLITIAAYLLVAGVLWSLNYYNSHLINEKINIIEKKDDLLNTILEARRYEKNYFLDHDKQHLEDALTFITQAETKLREVIIQHGLYTATPNLEQRLVRIQGYARALRHMADGYTLSAPRNAREKLAQKAEMERVSAIGRVITKETERMVKTEREHITKLIREAKIYHFSALAGLVALSIFTLVFFFLNVNRPLKSLEEGISNIAAGHYENIPHIPAGVEFESLVKSLNHMIRRLNRRNNELIQAKKMASLGTLTSGVAHELNNPLNNISTSIQIVLEELAEDNLDFKRELLESAEKEVERARDIVRALLEFSRQREFSIKPVSVRKLVEDTITLIRGDLPANVVIEVDIRDDITAALDFRRMQQVLLNLMINAIQAMQDGGTLRVSSFSEKGKEFFLQVSDTGCGIPGGLQSKIFDPFFSTKQDRVRQEGELASYANILEQTGTGLGLAICHGIVKKHGGTIAVDSEPGQGTVFTVTLPLDSEHKHAA